MTDGSSRRGVGVACALALVVGLAAGCDDEIPDTRVNRATAAEEEGKHPSPLPTGDGGRVADGAVPPAPAPAPEGEPGTKEPGGSGGGGDSGGSGGGSGGGGCGGSGGGSGGGCGF